eukprot:1154016-Amphidinium_carterae.1
MRYCKFQDSENNKTKRTNDHEPCNDDSESILKGLVTLGGLVLAGGCLVHGWLRYGCFPLWPRKHDHGLVMHALPKARWKQESKSLIVKKQFFQTTNTLSFYSQIGHQGHNLRSKVLTWSVFENHVPMGFLDSKFKALIRTM